MANPFEDEYVQQAARLLLLGGPVSLAAKRLQALRGLFDETKRYAISKGNSYSLTPAGFTFVRAQLDRVKPKPERDPEENIQQLGIEMPENVNERVLQALLKFDSKTPLSERELSLLEQAQVRPTHDDVLRIRSLHPFNLYLYNATLFDCSAQIKAQQEVILNQRTLESVCKVLFEEGSIGRVITVENKGAYIEYPLSPGLMVLYAPGFDSKVAESFLMLLPGYINWSHFGDLDQTGIDIGMGIAQRTGREADFVLPENLALLIKCYGKKLPLEGKQPWQPGKLPSELSARLARLIEERLWLEQEVMVFCLTAE